MTPEGEEDFLRCLLLELIAYCELTKFIQENLNLKGFFAKTIAAIFYRKTMRTIDGLMFVALEEQRLIMCMP